MVAFYTAAERLWGDESFWETGCGLGREAVLALLERGVRTIGTDAWSLDRPYPLIGAEWQQRRDPAALWPAHFAGIESSSADREAGQPHGGAGNRGHHPRVPDQG